MLFKNFDKFSSVLHFSTLKLLRVSCRKSLRFFSAHILKLCVISQKCAWKTQNADQKLSLVVSIDFWQNKVEDNDSWLSVEGTWTQRSSRNRSTVTLTWTMVASRRSSLTRCWRLERLWKCEMLTHWFTVKSFHFMGTNFRGLMTVDNRTSSWRLALVDF